MPDSVGPRCACRPGFCADPENCPNLRSGAGAGGGAGGVPPGAHAPCERPGDPCGGVAAALVKGNAPGLRALRLCMPCVADAHAIAGQFGLTIEVTPCNCGALAAAVRAVRAQGARGVAVQGPGCAVHGWQAVRS